MKILWLKTELLHPIDKGGKIRTYQMLKHLKRNHEITYLTLVDPDDTPEQYEAASEYCHRLVPIPFSAPPKFSVPFYRDLAVSLASPLPYVLRRYRSDAMRAAITKEQRENDYDVIVCDFLFACVNMPAERSTADVLFQHNVESTIWRRHYETAKNPVYRAFFYDQWRRLRAYERTACLSFDAVVAVSEEDRETMRTEFGVERVFDVPTGVDADFFQPLGGARNPAELVFTGSMDWIPNEDAIVYFARDILPLVAEKIPEVTLTVVGRKPTGRLLALAEENRRITVTGRVDDIRPYVDRAAGYIVPLRIGGGTRLKIYEAMCMGKAVVSTTVGAEGLPIRDGEELLIADTPSDFARAVCRVISEPELAERIGERARSVVGDRFGWERASSAFAEICERAIAARRAPTSSALATAAVGTGV